MEDNFAPRKSLSERYSLEAMANRFDLDIEEYKAMIAERAKIRENMINEQIKKGLTPEQAELQVLRSLYIEGFSGP